MLRLPHDVIMKVMSYVSEHSPCDLVAALAVCHQLAQMRADCDVLFQHCAHARWGCVPHSVHKPCAQLPRSPSLSIRPMQWPSHLPTLSAKVAAVLW